MNRLTLVRHGPYRLFFPMGIVYGILGVGHWLLWSVGYLQESNSFLHAMLQTEGFLASFVIGFFTTAMPRFLGAPTAAFWEAVCLFGFSLSFLIGALANAWCFAESAFIGLLVFALFFVGRRFVRRVKNPPPSFLLVAFGILHGITGPALILWSQFGVRSPIAMDMGRQMVQIGFLLCLVLGIAGYLTPFLMGYASDPSCDPSVSLIRSWHPAVIAFHGGTGAVLFMSFLMEPYVPRWAAALRAVLVAVHFLWFAHIARPLRNRKVYTFFFWLSCWGIVLGTIGVWLFPEFRIAMLHVLFIGGYSVMIFSFGLLVVFSHGGKAQRLNQPMPVFKGIGTCVLLAMGLRVAADVDAWHYQRWIHAASGFWVLGALVWLGYVWPMLWRNPIPDEN